MITKDDVRKAYRRGIISLELDPNTHHGTVAMIGDEWFYFGGQEADELDPLFYKIALSEGEIVNALYEVLDEFKTEMPREYDYYDRIFHENESHWAEIRCDYIDETDMFWRVDAWKSSNDNEEGSVIAYIDSITGRVLYTDPLARVDSYAQEVIKDKLSELKGVLKITSKPSNIEIQIPTVHGALIADIEPDEITGSGYDAMYLGLQPSEDPYVFFDLAAVRSHKDKDIVDILTWKDVMDEDYSEMTEISGDEIRDLMDSCK